MYEILLFTVKKENTKKSANKKKTTQESSVLLLKVINLEREVLSNPQKLIFSWRRRDSQWRTGSRMKLFQLGLDPCKGQGRVAPLNHPKIKEFFMIRFYLIRFISFQEFPHTNSRLNNRHLILKCKSNRSRSNRFCFLIKYFLYWVNNRTRPTAPTI